MSGSIDSLERKLNEIDKNSKKKKLLREQRLKEGKSTYSQSFYN